MGGGGSNYTGLTKDVDGLRKLTNNRTNANGTYSIVTAGTGSGTSAVVHIEGIGTELGNNGSSFVKVHVVVKTSTDSLYIMN